MVFEGLAGRRRRIAIWWGAFAMTLTLLGVPATGWAAGPEAPGLGGPEAPSRVTPAYRYSAPTGLVAKASARGANTIALNWTSRGLGVRYQVQYFGGWAWVGRVKTAAVASAAIGRLFRHTPHRFRVRVIDSRGKPASPWSALVGARTKTPADPKAKPLPVATYNIRNGVKPGSGRPWKVRRTVVADAIKKHKLAVIGLQEAEHNRVASGTSQYQDLINLLGRSYRIVSRAATAGTRIAYDSKKVTLIRQGSRKLSGDNKPKRYVVWAVFKQKSTKRQFLFVNTHLMRNPGGAVKSSGRCSKKATKHYKMRKKQASQVAATIRAHRGGLPVVLVGDMNSHKFHCPNNGPYRVFQAAGLIDPIGNPDRSKVPVRPSAEVRIHTEFDSSNHYKSAPKSHGWVNGTNVDYIWVSKAVTTLEYETVVNIDNSTLRFKGVVPSDHNMIRANVLIPKP